MKGMAKSRKGKKLEEVLGGGIHPDVGNVPRIQIYLNESDYHRDRCDDGMVVLSYKIIIGMRQLDGLWVAEARARQQAPMQKDIYLLEATYDNGFSIRSRDVRRFNVISPYVVKTREEAKQELHKYALDYARQLNNLFNIGILDFTGNGPRHEVECL